MSGDVVAVGVDPSLTSTGVAVIEPDASRRTVLSRIQSRGTREDTWTMRRDRLRDLTFRISDCVPAGSLIVIEGPAYSSTSGAVHDRSGLWWMLYEAFTSAGNRVVVATPQQRMKYATGKGRAHKDEVIAAVAKRYPAVPITGNDVCDAYVFALMAARLAGNPVEASLPQTHSAALDRLR